MAGDKVNNYSQVDTNILELQLTTDKTFKGYHQLTLTNYDNTTVPAIAAGSAIECNGALYKFDSEEAISTTDPVTSAAVADGTVYVCIVPGATTCTAAFTATAPTWSDSKQGWYGTGGQANYRYAGGATKATASYTFKFVLIGNHGTGLRYYRNTVSFGAIEDLIFNQITIEDLRMYAIGSEEIFSWTVISNSYSPVITIRKPCTVYLKNTTNDFSGLPYTINPGYYFLYQNDSSDYVYFVKHISSTAPINMGDKILSTDTGTTPSFLSYSEPGDAISVICIYAEGMNTLDSSKIVY
jgi:hypothetical protein